MKKTFVQHSISVWALSLSAALLCSATALAEDHNAVVLLEGAGVQVTDQDVLVETMTIPPEQRKAALSKPETVGQIALNIYTRKVLAADAIKAGAEKDDDTLKALALVREKTFMDYAIVHLDRRNALPAAEAEKQALASYKANSKKYEVAEQVKASHILVKFGDDPKAAKEKAEGILAELKGGANFAELAKAKSDDPGSAARGGDLGLFGRGKMVKPFEDAAFALKNPGDLSDIIESQFGYHVLVLTERKPAGVKPFEEVKDDLIAEVQKGVIDEGRKKEAKRIGDMGKIKLPQVEAFANSQK
ncbi:MAG: peptidylprolyl isomerase [Curvibacter sp.]|nr:MAG: peptidylprolyl isomerase [Curvibacter sp.]